MDKFVVQLSIAVFLCVLSCSSAIKYLDCGDGSKLGTLKAVVVKGCESTDTCQLKKGVNVSFEVDFIPNQVEEKLTMLVYGVIARIDIPFPLPNPNACSDSNVACPVQAGQLYKYQNTLFVKEEYPSLSLAVKLKLVDGAGNVVVCGMLKAQISSANSAL